MSKSFLLTQEKNSLRHCHVEKQRKATAPQRPNQGGQALSVKGREERFGLCPPS